MSVCRECGGDEARANREVDQLTEALRTCRKERDEAREKLTVNAAMGVMAREENLRLRSQLSEARAEVERLREAIRQANGTLWCVRNNVGCSTIETAEQMLDDALLPSPPSAKEAGA